ncbi:MAG: hypothetical protein R3F38_10880 [Gammaproteobacteria bacterium]
MHLSLDEKIVRMTGNRLNKKTEAEVLQTRIWLENIFRTRKISRGEFTKKISKNQEPTGIVLKWLKGIHAAKNSQVSEISKLFPGSQEIYLWPVFELLKNKPIPVSKLDSLMSEYIVTLAKLKCWDFPQPVHANQGDYPFPPIYLYDSEGLFERGDVFGFTGILYLVRKAEAERDSDRHFDAMMHAYRAFPAMCRTTPILSRWREALHCLRLIHARVLTTTMLLRPNIDIIEKQIMSKTHITRRISRERDQLTGRFSDIELPFQIAGF